MTLSSTVAFSWSIDFIIGAMHEGKRPQSERIDESFERVASAQTWVFNPWWFSLSKGLLLLKLGYLTLGGSVLRKGCFCSNLGT
ncbi:unnamed protein product [Caenorhabditis bovis]|uniref:Uncharacterized protein n=1 Tax=Caenorhabditis bovis TaxID=2654633 RepID=A0A8S1F5A7_9PELO|nr:unnamed protein product [Caenorhabditis bovis]